jgi:hypothetical protein
MSENKLSIPTEIVELPSKGLLYPKDSILASGKIEMKYMTAKEEDILTNQNYIKSGTVIDKLLQSLIVSKIDYNDLFIGDKNAVMVAARILSYGSKYEFNYNGVEQEVDLSSLEAKPLHPDFAKATSNNFTYTLPHSKNTIRFKLLTHGDETKIDQEIKGLQKINKNNTSEVTVRLGNIITAINGSEDPQEIREFVNNYFLARDAREFRKFYSELTPDVDLDVTLTNSEGGEEVVSLPIGVNFFWPDA